MYSGSAPSFDTTPTSRTRYTFSTAFGSPSSSSSPAFSPRLSFPMPFSPTLNKRPFPKSMSHPLAPRSRPLTVVVFLLGLVCLFAYFSSSPSGGGGKWSASTIAATASAFMRGDPVEQFLAVSLRDDFAEASHSQYHPSAELLRSLREGDFAVARRSFDGKGKKNFMTLCLTAQDEGRFWDEFLIYHTLLGFDHFVVYDNGSSDDTLDKLGPYITSGLVTFYKVSNQKEGHQFQNNLIRECFMTYEDKSLWVAHFDVDEYLHVPTRIGISQAPSQADEGPWQFPLHRPLSTWPLNEALAFVVARVDVVNVGRQQLRNDQLLVEQQQWRRPTAGFEMNKFTKSFIQTNFTSPGRARPDGPHVLALEDPKMRKSGKKYFVDSRGDALPTTADNGWYMGESPDPAVENLVLLHYIQRDLADCETKYNMRVKCCPNNWRVAAGKGWCSTGDGYVPLTGGSSTKEWTRGVVVQDLRVMQSFAARATKAILAAWEKQGRPKFSAARRDALMKKIDHDLEFYHDERLKD